MVMGVGARLHKSWDEIGQMDGQELASWAAYLYSEHDVEQMLVARRSAILANAHRSRRIWEPMDFMPPRRIRDRGEMKVRLVAWSAGTKGIRRGIK
jgi:hypothetical protein